MKKTLVSALTTALVVGAASTTFAAANPFEDVPADHWAYDAVAQLAKDGVVEGYGDGTYVGDAAITRYEMAQMVAKAMTKSDLKHADKAMVDKLAAEFADELNNLGVRVAKLEKKVDNVKWDGQLRYRYYNRNNDKGRRASTNELLARLQINAEINENWTARARFDYYDGNEMKNAKNVMGTGSIRIDRLWAVGKYGNTVIELGRLPHTTQFDYGASMADKISGGKVTFGKDVKVAVAIGRYNFDNYGLGSDNWLTGGAASKPGETGSYQSIEVYNDRAKKFTWGLGYQHIKTSLTADDNGNDGNLNLLGIGLGYKFDKNVQIKAAFDKASGMKDARTGDKQQWFVEVDYKGAKNTQKGSWGAYVAYRHVGACASLYSAWRLDNAAFLDDFKGIDIGAQYVFFKNIKGTVKYITGKTASNWDDGAVKYNAIFTQVDMFF